MWSNIWARASVAFFFCVDPKWFRGEGEQNQTEEPSE